MRTVLAGDLGGTKCRFALVGEDLSVHAVRQCETVRAREPFLDAFDRTIAATLAAAPAGLATPTTAGFGVAGLVPRGASVVRDATNLPLNDFALGDHVRERFGLLTTVINDGRASAWGEYLRGHAAGADPLLCLFFGTGIGIGLMVCGEPYGGGENAAGEIGHTTFVPNGRRCPCGRDGHFEAYCGGRPITERAAALLGPAATGSWTVGGVAAAAAAGDADARTILDEAAVAASVLVENLCTLLNPAAVVLGGGVVAGWPELRQRIEAHVRGSTRRIIHSDLQFVSSLGGSDAILQGAAAATGTLSPA